ncbi:MAG: hypothetical protein RID07_08410 [Lacipirellulaceae bacterium]
MTRWLPNSFLQTLSAALLATLVVSQSGCSLLLPEVTHRPVIRNPFPQLSRVAVAPFFNQSDEPTVDGREFAISYYAELQATPGFEVVPVGVVEEAIIRHQIDLNGPGEAPRLATILGVEAVAIGSVTDFSAYYPPRLGLKVEWYSSNVSHHEIPAGYGLPWNTPEEEFIPDSLVYEAQLAQARAEMTSQPSPCDAQTKVLPPPPGASINEESDSQQAVYDDVQSAQAAGDPFDEPTLAFDSSAAEALPLPAADGSNAQSTPELLHLPTDNSGTSGIAGTTPSDGMIGTLVESPAPPACVPHYGPVLNHTQIYRGNDPETTEALKGYVYFQDDARFGGWEGYLQRSDDFIRFCCHMHISEMLSARGGSRKTSVVWRWPDDR